MILFNAGRGRPPAAAGPSTINWKSEVGINLIEYSIVEDSIVSIMIIIIVVVVVVVEVEIAGFQTGSGQAGFL